MLPAVHRLTSAEEFRCVTRAGRRRACDGVVVHWLAEESEPTESGFRAGFVVSKSVGNAVVRNRVKRRLRHLVAHRIGDWPSGWLVVRALPAAATASSAQLAHGLDTAFERATRTTQSESSRNRVR